MSIVELDPVTSSAAGRGPGASWFAVADAARDSTFLHLPAGIAPRRQSLYAGELGELLDDVAPHLVAADPFGAFGEWTRERAAPHWGVWLRSDGTFEAVRRHLRRFLLARDEAGLRYRFRFYDPRVLSALLPVCSEAELVDFFGPIELFRVPGASGAPATDYRLVHGVLSTGPVPPRGLRAT